MSRDGFTAANYSLLHTEVDHRDKDGFFTVEPGGRAKDAGQNRRGSGWISEKVFSPQGQLGSRAGAQGDGVVSFLVGFPDPKG